MGFFRAIIDFLTFKRMMGPLVLQILFWISALGIAIFAARMMDQGRSGAWMVLGGGLIGLRVLFEMVLVFFRIHNRLTDIHNTLKSVETSASEIE
ncbi:MAG: hypothetical protein AAF441_14580 [Pseudomonadota bacterium]